jgi:hypothetical protein
MEGGMHLTTICKKTAEYPICIPVHYPKGEQIYKNAYDLPGNTRTLVYPRST